MSNVALWRKAIDDSRLLWLACATLLYVFAWVQVWITSQVDMRRFQGILDNLPEAWQRLSPVPFAELASYPARIALTYEAPLVYLAIAAWAVARSSDCVSGEIGRGTMEMVLSQPVSRLHVLVAPSIVTVVGAALLAGATWCGTFTGISTLSVDVSRPITTWTVPLVGIDIPLGGAVGQSRPIPMRELAHGSMLAPAALNLAALGFFLAGVGTFLSSWDRYRWRTIGIMVAFYVVQMMLEVVALAVEGWSWLKYFTFFSAYEPVAIISRSRTSPDYAWSWILLDDHGQWLALGPLGYSAVLGGLGLVAFLMAALIFVRRDFPAPL